MKIFSGLILGVVAQAVLAADPGIPLEKASKAYLAKGADAFVPTLLKGSLLENDKSTLAQANILRKVESQFGLYHDCELIYEKSITSKVRLVYYALNFEKSVLFGSLTYYKRGNEETVTSLHLKTDIFEILPEQTVLQLRTGQTAGGRATQNSIGQ